MHQGLDEALEVERHDVFLVTQVTRDTPLESVVGADLVEVEPHQESSMHRHNNAETVLYFTAGRGEVLLTEDYEVVPVSAGQRLHIGKGVFHAVRTDESPLHFVSIQSPPILDKHAGSKDLEPLEDLRG